MTPRPVIGLEVHVRLATRTKLFCGCRNRHDASPNSLVCPVCLGLPGTLPVLNRRAVDLAVRLGVALGCDVADHSDFARKTYFYPDLPRNYQITQHERPLCRGGALDIGPPDARHPVALERIHLEEDAGKSLAGEDGRRVDLNRAGAPLVEIVTRPVLESADEADHFLRELRRLVRALGVGDGDMERGSLRCDANISLRPAADAAPGERVELKNLNSLRGVRMALAHEIERQGEVNGRGGTVARETRGWDARRGASYFMRAKEEASDYRYLVEPDLPPLRIEAADAARVRTELPELPCAREERYVLALGLPMEVASTLCESTEIAAYFESVLADLGDARIAANWVAGDVLRLCGARGVTPDACPVAPAASADLLSRVARGELSLTAAKRVFETMAAESIGADAIIAREGFDRAVDRDVLVETVRREVADHPEQADAYRAGKRGVADWLTGRVMAATGGRADPALCAKLVRETLAEPSDKESK